MLLTQQRLKRATDDAYVQARAEWQACLRRRLQHEATMGRYTVRLICSDVGTGHELAARFRPLAHQSNKLIHFTGSETWHDVIREVLYDRRIRWSLHALTDRVTELLIDWSGANMPEEEVEAETH